MKPDDLTPGHVYANRLGHRYKFMGLNDTGDARFRYGPSQVMKTLPAVQFARMCLTDVTIPPSLNLAK